MLLHIKRSWLTYLPSHSGLYKLLCNIMVLHVSHNRQKAQPIVCTYWYSMYVYGHKCLQNAPLAIYVVDPGATMQFSNTCIYVHYYVLYVHIAFWCLKHSPTRTYPGRFWKGGFTIAQLAPCIHLYVYTRYIMRVLYMLHAYSQVYIYIHTYMYNVLEGVARFHCMCSWHVRQCASIPLKYNTYIH